MDENGNFYESLDIVSTKDSVVDGQSFNTLIDNYYNNVTLLVDYKVQPGDMSEEEILELNIPTGVPLVYEFDENFKPLKRYYLGNADEIAAKAAAVANQGKAK